jgi:hypothetical protein
MEIGMRMYLKTVLLALTALMAMIGAASASHRGIIHYKHHMATGVTVVKRGLMIHNDSPNALTGIFVEHITENKNWSSNVLSHAIRPWSRLRISLKKIINDGCMFFVIETLTDHRTAMDIGPNNNGVDFCITRDLYVSRSQMIE